MRINSSRATIVINRKSVPHSKDHGFLLGVGAQPMGSGRESMRGELGQGVGGRLEKKTERRGRP